MKKRIYIIYNLTVSSFFVLTGLNQAHTLFEMLISLIYLPLVFYFSKELIRQIQTSARLSPSRPLTLLAKAKKKRPIPSYLEPALAPERGQVIDIDRRTFLRLIGSAGFSLFLLSLFTKKAQAAFFGSVPGPGTVALKDIAGNKIDPAKHHPTAGFKIARLDDTSSATYAYYGFVDKTGAWYLQREQLTGADAGQYLYSTGSSDFSTAWTNRVSPTPAYATFDNTF